MSIDLREKVILGLTEDERLNVTNGKPLIKAITLIGKDGKKLPALATVYNRPGQGVYRKQTFGVVVIPMSIDALRGFLKALSEQADKLEDSNLDNEDDIDSANSVNGAPEDNIENALL
jgi:hypothetical protein